MSWLAGRLARGSGRGELVRAVLVALGAALVTALLLAAALVSAVRRGDCRQGCDSGSPYSSDLLNQAGLRPGVVTGLVLMVVPALVFLGMCARISAAQRDRRLSAVRLAGADPRHVRLLAAAETGVPAAVGALVGAVAFGVAKVLLERHHLDTAAGGSGVVVLPGLSSNGAMAASRPRALPTDVSIPALRSLLVVLLVPVLCAASAVLALRQVQTTPLGVIRRARPAPRASAFALLALGLVVLVGAPFTGRLVLLTGTVAAVLVLLGVAACGSWLAARAGALTAGRTASPALLLAARRLQADPHAQGRALSGVVLAVLVASGAAVLRADALVLDRDGLQDSFYTSAYDLVFLGLVVALAVAAAGLFVAACEQILERRRTLVGLWAVGVPRATLSRAVVLQAVLPAVPALLLAAVVGALVGELFTTSGPQLPWLQLLAVFALALAAVGLSALLTLPLLRRSAQPAELRQT